MGVADSWRAVIDSLSAGYRFLGRHVELILIPIALDLWLWLGPRLGMGPLFDGVANFYADAAALEDLPADMSGMADQVSLASQMLADLGQQSNLMEYVMIFVVRPLAHVPSLLVARGAGDGNWVLEIRSPLTAFGLFTGLGVIGLLIGVLYMNLLARRLPLGSASRAVTAGGLVKMVLRQWLMVMLFIVVMTALFVGGALPVSLGAGLLYFVSPGLGSIVAFLFSYIYFGVVLVVSFYLYFVTAAIVMDDLPLHRAMAQSYLVVRNNFLATLLFVLLTTVISWGVAIIMLRLADLFAAGIAIAIPINAYIGSGLALALFIFYRTRILRTSAAQGDAVVAGRTNGQA